MDTEGLVHFGSAALDVPLPLPPPRKSIAGVVKAAAASSIRALVIDARSAADFFRAQELLRTLYDDPRRPRPLLAPGRVLALIATGDVEAAFTIGRYGVAGVLEERALGQLGPRLRRMLALASNPAGSPAGSPAG